MDDVWVRLEQTHGAVKDRPILSLFDDPTRFDRFSAQSDGLLLDYSKTNLDGDSRALLIDLATNAGVAAMRDAMFAGEKINTTEDRAVDRKSVV